MKISRILSPNSDRTMFPIILVTILVTFVASFIFFSYFYRPALYFPGKFDQKLFYDGYLYVLMTNCSNMQNDTYVFENRYYCQKITIFIPNQTQSQINETCNSEKCYI